VQQSTGAGTSCAGAAAAEIGSLLVQPNELQPNQPTHWSNGDGAADRHYSDPPLHKIMQGRA